MSTNELMPPPNIAPVKRSTPKPAKKGVLLFIFILLFDLAPLYHHNTHNY